MAISIGRLGYLGFATESSQGAFTAPAVYLPFTDVSIRGHHESIDDIASKSSRLMNKDSVIGKKWSEGDIKINLDAVNSGYLWRLALGNEVYIAGTPANHTFYTTYSGNTPATASIVFDRGGTDVEQYLGVACDELSLEVSDGLAEVTASVMGNFPTEAAAYVPTTTSGTVFSFKDLSIKFGTDLTTAASATATPVNDFSLTIANNLEVIHRSGSADVSTIRTKGIQVSGSYTLFFDSETDKDAYYALNKRAFQATFAGIANESMRIRIPRFKLSEGDISTGLDDFFVIKAEFQAEDFVDASTSVRFIDVLLQNSKTGTY